MTIHFSAGFPADLGHTRNYDEAFRQLKAAGITAFFPYSAQYLICSPDEPEYLDWIEDFVPPKVFEKANPAIAALKAHGLQLILNGELFYHQGVGFPTTANDPVKRLIAVHGKDIILALWGADEPAMNGTSTTYLSRVHTRCSSLGVPVWICQAPMTIDRPDLWGMAWKRNAYMAKCLAHAAYCSRVLFDIYPIPPETCALYTPDSKLATDIKTAVGSYAAWTAAKLPTKARGIVLQAHAIPDFYSPSIIPDAYRADLLKVYRNPSPAELQEQATAAACDVIGWYGPSFQRSVEAENWVSLLGLSGQG